MSRFELEPITIPGCAVCDQPADFKIADTLRMRVISAAYCWPCAVRELDCLNGPRDIRSATA